MFLRSLNILFLLIFCGTSICAQEDSLFKLPRNPRPCEVKLKDGASYKGTIEKQDSIIYLRASSGVLIHIPKSKITEIDFAKEPTKSDTTVAAYVVVLPSIGKRYYVTTTNASLFRRKEIFVSSSYLLFYHINYSMSQHFSLGISTSIIGSPLGIQAKANFEIVPRVFLGFEGVAGSLMYLGPKTYGTGGVAKLSFGKENRNYTFFGGYADAMYWVAARRGGRGRPTQPGNYYLRFSSPFAGAAGSWPLTGRTNLVAEAFAFPNISIYTAAAALRTVRWQRASLVFGIQVVGNLSANVNKAFSFPYGGFSATF